jgi:hypothetical protein
MRALMIIPILLLATSSVAADKRGTRDQLAVEKALAGKVPGKPKSCLSSHDSDGSSVHNGTVLFRASSKLVWKNDMNGCPSLREDDILVTQSYGSSQLCRGDLVKFMDRTSLFIRGACTFGDFVPYRKPDQAP